MSTKRDEAVYRYQKKAIKQINLKLHKINDKDIIDLLQKQESVNGFIKQCIREHKAK